MAVKRPSNSKFYTWCRKFLDAAQPGVRTSGCRKYYEIIVSSRTGLTQILWNYHSRDNNFIILSYVEASIFGSISSISNPRLSAEMIDCVTPSYNTATARRLAGTHEEWFYLLMNKSLWKGRKYGQWCRPRLICGFRGTLSQKGVLSRARR